MRALSELPTPCLLLDQSKLDRNLARMAERMRSLKVDLKPHLKTAKSAEIATRATAGFSGGITVSHTVVHALFDEMVDTALSLGAGLDWKTSLQELAAERGLGVPEYVIESEGPDHRKSFTARVRLVGALYGNGSGSSKKEAEQMAASSAYADLTGTTDAST